MKKLILLAGILFSHFVSAQNSWNTAAVFNGTNYYSDMISAVNGTTGEMTVEFWIKLYSSATSYTIIGKDQFRIMTDDNNLRIQISNSTLFYSTAKLDSGNWNHVAVVHSAAGDYIKVYINGALDKSYNTFTGALTGTADSLMIGKSIYAGNLVGELDEVRIWRTVRSGTEIANNYKNHIGWYTTSYYDANLVFCQTYEFDVYSPGTYFPYGGAHGSFGADVLGATPSKTVMHNSSMYFTGSSYLEANAANDPNVALTGAMTVEAWIYPLSIGTAQTIVDGTTGGGYKMTLESTGKISWVMNQVGTSTVVLAANRWYHIAVVCPNPVGSNQEALIYIDGQYDIGYNYSQMIAGTGKFRVGATQSGTNFFNGFIDEVRISNFAKTPVEIRHNLHTPILHLNKPVAPSSTVAYNFDGNLYSGTRLGYSLINHGCRFSYASETPSPLFHMGYNHESVIDSFVTKHPFVSIPATGTAGYTYDTLHFNPSIMMNENNFKVFLSLNHDYSSDLKIELLSPTGDSVLMVNQVSGKKGITCVLDNQTTDVISGQYTDFSPRIGSANPFTVFNGKNSSGVWTLKITDLSNGFTGILNSWGLLIGGTAIAVKEINRDNVISVFPNPSNTKNVYIKSSLADFRISNIRVLNLTGQIIYQQDDITDEKNIPVNLSPETAAGIYILKVTDGAKQYQSKFIVN